MSGVGKPGQKRQRAEDASSSSMVVGDGAGAAGASSSSATANLKTRLIKLLETQRKGMLQRDMEEMLDLSSEDLLPALQQLLNEKRLQMYNQAGKDGKQEISWKIISAESAARLQDLQPEDQLVLQLIEKSGNQGVWVRNIKIASRLQQTQINKVIKRLEGRKLIKPVRSVAFKARRMYMLYELEPAKQLTGGPWYTEQELDLEFIQGVRTAVLRILDEENGGPMSADDVASALVDKGISKVPLTARDIKSILDTLHYDGMVDIEGISKKRIKQFAAASRAMYPHGGADIALKYDASTGSTMVVPPTDEFVDDDTALNSRGRLMQLRVGGAPESRIGLGSGLARRAAQTAATCVSLFGELGESDHGGAGAGAGSGKLNSSGNKGGSKSKSNKYGCDDDDADEEEEEDEDDYELEEEDEADDDTRSKRYYLTKKGGGVDNFTGTPCGVCPVMDKCVPGGLAGSGSEAESALIVKLLREAGGKTYAELQVAEGLAEEADLPRNASDVMV